MPFEREKFLQTTGALGRPSVRTMPSTELKNYIARNAEGLERRIGFDPQIQRPSLSTLHPDMVTSVPFPARDFRSQLELPIPPFSLWERLENKN